MPLPLFTPGKDLVPIVQEAGWAPGPVWTGAGNLAPTGIRSLEIAQPVASILSVGMAQGIALPFLDHDTRRG